LINILKTLYAYIFHPNGEECKIWFHVVASHYRLNGIKTIFRTVGAKERNFFLVSKRKPNITPKQVDSKTLFNA
jgi:hypothetical protein